MAERKLAPVPEPDAWDALNRQWQRSLRAVNRTLETRRSYEKSLNRLKRWALAEGFASPEDMTAGDLLDYFGWALDRTTNHGRKASPAAVAKDFRELRVFFGWLAKLDDPAGGSIMAGMTAPHVPKKPVPILSDDQIRALLKARTGRGFTERRDTAMIRLLSDTGMRRAELAGIKVTDLDQNRQRVDVLGKGQKVRPVPYGNKTAEALDAYLRVRAKHKDARRPELWLAGYPHRGALGYDGVALMLKRTAEKAGVPGVHAHKFRHTAAHAYLKAGGTEGDAMRNFGWETRTMVDHYGASAASERAIDAAHALNVGDRI